MKGRIHSFESLAAVDGKGLRVAVFLSGCPLRCVYCHNPDTWSPSSGKEMTPEELVRKILRFRPYFSPSGGVTFTGGEPLLQAEFLQETTRILKKEGISWVVDTAGAVFLSPAVKEVLLGAEEVLLDIKFWEETDYRAYTGFSMEHTLATLRFLEEGQIPVTVRTVVVPGINDTEESLMRYAELIRLYSCVHSWELLAFHTMGFFKYEKLGLQNPLLHTPALSAEKRDRLQRFADGLFSRKNT